MDSTIKKGYEVANLPDGSVKISFKVNKIAKAKPGFLGSIYILSVVFALPAFVLFSLISGSVVSFIFFAICEICALVIPFNKVIGKETDLVVNSEGIIFDRPGSHFSSVFGVNMTQLAFKDINNINVHGAGKHSFILALARGQEIQVTGTMPRALAHAIFDEIKIVASDSLAPT